MRLTLLLTILILWPPFAGAAVLFTANGLGPYGAFSDLPSVGAQRSLLLAAREGFALGVKALPFLSLTPTLFVFGARRFLPRFAPDVLAGAAAGMVLCALFLTWTLFSPLDPLVGGLPLLVCLVFVVCGALTGRFISWLRPRAGR